MTVFHEQCLKLWKSALIEHVDKKQETQTSRKTETKSDGFKWT